MSLINEEPWHFAFRWKGRRYRGSCKTSRQLEDGRSEGRQLEMRRRQLDFPRGNNS
jgi:hypothetical protein